MALKAEVAVIVPVYNAPGDLGECVESVLANTDGPYRLVLIDDASPDPAVGEYLNGLAARGLGHVEIKRNEKNLGFVGTVNRGMRECASDVVLLNADTVVTSGWLERISECAYSEPSIASVTPFTNNGTICSVPNFCEDNPLPEGFTPEAMGALVESVSMRSYPRIPTAVGFCMYIKREALDEVGLFDEVTFGKGYAEENDWCCRASELGYVHALDDATFIYHKGAMSFLGEKARMIEENLKLLIKKYPYYFDMVDGFVAGNPLWDAQENIRFHLGVALDRRVRLLIGLEPGWDADGRLEGIISERADDGAALYGFWVEEGRTMVVAPLTPDKGVEGHHRFPLEHEVGFPSYMHPGYAGTLLKVVRTFGIDAVVMAGLLSHSLDVFHAVHDAGVPVAAVLGPGVICPGGPENLCMRDMRGCREAYAEVLWTGKLAGNPTAFMEKWFSELRTALAKADGYWVPEKGAELANALMPGFDTARAGLAASLPLDGRRMASAAAALSGKGRVPDGGGFAWPEIAESMRDKRHEAGKVERGYTEKQKQAFDFMISIANRNPGPLRLAKFLYRLISSTRKR